MLAAQTFRDPDEFLDSLKTLEPDRINVCVEASRIWLGYFEKGAIIIQEYKSLDELLSFVFKFGRYHGARYGDFIDLLLSDLDRTEQDLIDDFLYTGKA